MPRLSIFQFIQHALAPTDPFLSNNPLPTSTRISKWRNCCKWRRQGLILSFAADEKMKQWNIQGSKLMKKIIHTFIHSHRVIFVLNICYKWHGLIFEIIVIVKSLTLFIALCEVKTWRGCNCTLQFLALLWNFFYLIFGKKWKRNKQKLAHHDTLNSNVTTRHTKWKMNWVLTLLKSSFKLSFRWLWQE